MSLYLDYQATTPVAPEVAAAMRPWLEERFANPHSAHRPGRAAAAAVEAAREQVSAGLDVASFEGSVEAGAQEGRLFFTSGATEALNWALKGLFAAAPEGRRRVVTVTTEHAAVLDTVEWLQRQGAELVRLPVDRDGLVDPEQARAAVDSRTALVAIMSVNNEIGVIQADALRALSEAAREVEAPLVCDNVAGFGRASVPVRWCDLIAISAHKVHGPKGIGALWIRRGQRVEPLLHGGGQEGGMRSGTLSPALCVGFGEAVSLLAGRWREDRDHARRLFERLRARLGPGWTLNGSAVRRWHGNMNVRAEGVDAARLISELRQLAFSAGSACASGSGRSSHVLRAIGLTDREARSSVRLGFGRYTTTQEIDVAGDLIREAAARQGKHLA